MRRKCPHARCLANNFHDMYANEQFINCERWKAALVMGFAILRVAPVLENQTTEVTQ